MIQTTWSQVQKACRFVYGPKPVHFVCNRLGFHRRYPLETLDLPFLRSFLLKFTPLGFASLAGLEFHENPAITGLLARLAGDVRKITIEDGLEVFIIVSTDVRATCPDLFG